MASTREGESAVDPSLVAALGECLQRYTRIDEDYRKKTTGKGCSCGNCLMCRSRALLLKLKRAGISFNG